MNEYQISLQFDAVWLCTVFSVKFGSICCNPLSHERYSNSDISKLAYLFNIVAMMFGIAQRYSALAVLLLSSTLALSASQGPTESVSGATGFPPVSYTRHPTPFLILFYLTATSSATPSSPPASAIESSSQPQTPTNPVSRAGGPPTPASVPGASSNHIPPRKSPSQ